MRTRISISFYVLVVICLICSPNASRAQSTAFSYQGRLNVLGSPANGSYDLTFALFDGGNAQVGSTITNLSVQISNGLLMATLDFGSQFNGQDRWLEISVRTNGGLSFVTLSPRQPISATPYALFATTAANLAVQTFVPSAANYGSVLDTNASQAFEENVFVRWITLDTNKTYWVTVPGQGNGNDLGVASDTNGFSDLLQSDGYFKPLQSTVGIYSASSGSSVGTQIVLETSNVYGNLGGTFDGSLTTNSTIPLSAIPNGVILQGHPLNGQNIISRTTVSLGAPGYNIIDVNVPGSTTTNTPANGGILSSELTLTILNHDPKQATYINFSAPTASSGMSEPQDVQIGMAGWVYGTNTLGGFGIGNDFIPFALNPNHDAIWTTTSMNHAAGQPSSLMFFNNKSAGWFGGHAVLGFDYEDGLGSYKNSPATGHGLTFIIDETARTTTSYGNAYFNSNVLAQSLTVTNNITIGTAQILNGAGSPLGVVSAPPGSFYLNKLGGVGATFWVKETGTDATGWAPK